MDKTTDTELLELANTPLADLVREENRAALDAVVARMLAEQGGLVDGLTVSKFQSAL